MNFLALLKKGGVSGAAKPFIDEKKTFTGGVGGLDQMAIK